MDKLLYCVLFHPEESGGYSTTVPDFEGCFSEGESLAEAYEMTADAIGLCMEELKANNHNFPKASSPEQVHVQSPDFVALIEFDPVAYGKKYNTKAIKKTLTIPSWLNQIAEENHINFSSVLQNALKSQLNI